VTLLPPAHQTFEKKDKIIGRKKETEHESISKDTIDGCVDLLKYRIKVYIAISEIRGGNGRFIDETYSSILSRRCRILVS
jgi:hypothetical protein